MGIHDDSPRADPDNEAGEVVTYNDENGAVVSESYDALGHKVMTEITPAAGSGIKRRQLFFDDESRVTMMIEEPAEGTLGHAVYSYGPSNEEREECAGD